MALTSTGILQKRYLSTHIIVSHGPNQITVRASILAKQPVQTPSNKSIKKSPAFDKNKFESRLATFRYSLSILLLLLFPFPFRFLFRRLILPLLPLLPVPTLYQFLRCWHGLRVTGRLSLGWGLRRGFSRSSGSAVFQRPIEVGVFRLPFGRRGFVRTAVFLLLV